MISRADVERAILEHEAVLDEVVRLLEGRADLAVWSDDARAAFALALDDASMSRTESWKSVTLRRHLFGPSDVVPVEIAAISAESDAAIRACAERVRAGLPARVRYRAGMYLLQPSR
jgi:hypothetical protein